MRWMERERKKETQRERKRSKIALIQILLFLFSLDFYSKEIRGERKKRNVVGIESLCCAIFTFKYLHFE